MLFGSSKQIKISRDDEARHFLTCADSGRGKTQFICQILDYIEACGDTAVVLDAKLELLPRYFNASRGDKVLSPKDDRCPYWHIGDEITDYADAMSVTRAMYAFRPQSGASEFFDDQACKIGAYLLVNGNPSGSPKPTCEQYGQWLQNPEEIYRRIRGTQHEHTLDKNAAPQKAGVIANMNRVGDALRMMPTERENRPYFTIRQWCQHRRGWLFLPNPAEIREALRPLQSMWADLLLLRLMSMRLRTDLPRVWLVLDEVDSLNTLPQLTTAITEIRSAGIPMVIGMQNLAQLETRYERQSATIFSQPLTKLILATSHGDSAKSIERLIGDVEIRRFRENRSGSLMGEHDRNSFSGPEDITKPLVLASQVQGLADLEGYLIQRGKVVKVQLPYIDRPEKAPAWIERQIPALPRPIDFQDPSKREAQTAAVPAAVPVDMSAFQAFHRMTQADLDALL